MSNSIFYSLLLALFVFELQSIGAIPPYLDSGENVVEDTTLVFNNNIDNADDHHSISADQDLLNKSINVESHVDESSSCSGISLDFSNMNIGYAVRNYFINGSYVQNLSLAHNKIEEFDNGAFDGLSNLKYLDLSYNKLSPTKMLSFGGHATLETLIFDYNEPVQQLEWYYEYGYNRQRMINVTLPISIPTSNIYPKLKNLSLRGTSIIPSFDNWDQSFPSLEKLDLSYVNLESVTNSEFSQSFPSSVKILILQSTSLQTAIFDNLSNLEELDVTGNSFENGLGFLNCPNLKKLNLFNTRIDNVPSDLNDQCQNIEELNMGENRIEDIDSSAFENLNKLKVLDLSNNPLKKIDFIASLSQLNTLILDDMQNSKIIEFLNTHSSSTHELNLKYLSLKNNNLTNLPENFINSLKLLEEIDLSGNNLASVTKLPTTLKTLNLQNNNINYLDEDLLRSLSNLKEIKVGNNPIKQLEIELISNLPKSCILNWE
ncbi:protein artichoke isoform X1 [Trichogramma pretiosum]|uniref:protein artichoke isoform X1 n=1 Tax=Trichogramma pretiosum TaxID=7493 RepID=UPI000C71C339|nr:protein artichoke isoform X1 [Trichogramma pretiosum]